MSLDPYAPGPPCSCCDSYCGVDVYDYKGEDVCAGCLKTLETEGIIVGHCYKCGTLIDSDMPLLKTKDKELVCERCHRKYNEDGDADR